MKMKHFAIVAATLMGLIATPVMAEETSDNQVNESQFIQQAAEDTNPYNSMAQANNNTSTNTQEPANQSQDLATGDDDY